MRLLLLTALLVLSCELHAAQTVVVGSKKFTESYVLAEIAKRKLTQSGFDVVHKQGMGGTIILWQAIKGGDIDFYPEYTGTIVEEILKSRAKLTSADMRRELRRFKIGMTEELGFNNTYALVMRREQAKKLGIESISDLRKHPDLQVGLTHEFLNRQDGWGPLSRRYNLHMANVRGVEHTIGYSALANGSLDVKDAYSTDAKIAEYNLIVLKDDLGFFPQYKAVFLYRLSAPEKAIQTVESLSGTISEEKMIQLNAEAERTKNYARAAGLYFAGDHTGNVADLQPSVASQIGHWTLQHLRLVGISLILAVIAGIPLGIAASRPGPLSQTILGVTGVVQTIPSLALLAVLVPLMGIKPQTAILALFLYSLLPIVRNTASGLQDIPTPLRESASALGLEPLACLRKVLLPMASRSILAGIKTSAVINVGTATLAALIGAGGLGTPIISGLDLADAGLIMQGALPAAALALIVQWAFDFCDRYLIPKGLRLQRAI
ncbi:MAG: ABC transporter permease subunit [Armatimonadetes bacterium]|nr:ABC transporter permease subunit [Armatimonadota bacterium]